MKATLTIVLLFIIGCGAQEPALLDNPIAACTASSNERTSVSCVTLRLSIDRLTSTDVGGSVHGLLIAENHCENGVAVLTAPIDTRLTASVAWEQSLTSSYARFSVYRSAATGEDMHDKGFSVHTLPLFVIVPPHVTQTFPLEGETERLRGLQEGVGYFAQVCTFVAPAESEARSSATTFAIDRSIAFMEKSAQDGCVAILRPSSTLICTPPVSLRRSL